jgi:hypothetical protein
MLRDCEVPQDRTWRQRFVVAVVRGLYDTSLNCCMSRRFRNVCLHFQYLTTLIFCFLQEHAISCKGHRAYLA